MKHLKEGFLKKTFSLLCFLFIVSLNSFSQSATMGTEFWVAFGRIDTIANPASISLPDSYINTKVDLRLQISAAEATTVTLTFMSGAVKPVTLNLAAGEVMNYVLKSDYGNDQVKASYTGVHTVTNYTADPSRNVFSKKSIYVHSTKPIALVAVSMSNLKFEATNVLPIEKLGKEYFHSAWDTYDVSVSPQRHYHSDGYIIVATEDNTEITQSFVNNHLSYIYYAGEGKFTMQKGQVYHYYRINDNHSNPINASNNTGTRITSNKPIAYFQSGTAIMEQSVTITQSGAGNTENYGFEQIPPVEQWGKKFIMPSVVNENHGSNNIGRVRVFAPYGANITIKYSDGTVGAPVAINARKFHQINFNETAKKAAYIESDQPVGVFFLSIPWRVSSGWLPPLAQKIRNVHVNPLSLSGVLALVNDHTHYFLVIAPHASRSKTTISLNGNAPQALENDPDFKWITEDVGGSGYAVGRYYFGKGHSDNLAKKKAVVDHPEGVIVLAYSGNASYGGYFYAAGHASFNLGYPKSISGTISGLESEGGNGNRTIKYTVNGGAEKTVISDADGKYKIEGIFFDDNVVITADPVGCYQPFVVEEPSTSRVTEDITDKDIIYSQSVIWTAEASNNNWHDRNNWSSKSVPMSCNNVYIPGNVSHYPLLNDTDNNSGKYAMCNAIYFIYGSELGRPDLLTYDKAFVQYNFGLKQSSQEINSDKKLVISSNSVEDRMKFSAGVSATPMNRERWYMLSSPLADVVSGDLGFGGFPLTFLKKFGPVNKGNEQYEVGTWTTPYNTMIEPVSNRVTDGFAYYLFGFGNNSSDNTGCDESGYFGEFNESKYMPYRASGSKKRYGIKKTNGILELPSFADTTKLYAHRTQVYNGSDQSTFYYVSDGSDATFNNIIVSPTPEIVSRSNRNYRFAPEKNGVFATTLTHDINGFKDGEEFLLGNPYMSSIDMVKFIEDNYFIAPHFWIWDGNNFLSSTVNPSLGIVQTLPPSSLDMRYVSPLQGFLLRKSTSVPTLRPVPSNENIYFNVEKISTVRPTGSTFNLRNTEDKKEENLIRIKAENSNAATYAVIAYMKGASNNYVANEDVQKFFTPLKYVPSVYSLANETPVDINFINNHIAVTVPLGIKTEKTGEISLTFTGMDNYTRANKIEFIDALENKTIDMTKMPSYTYTFNHNKKGIQNGRFSIKISPAMSSSITDLQDVASSEGIEIYGNFKEIFVVSPEPVLKLEIYDFSGKKLYENNSGARYYPLPDNLSKFPIIVKAMTKDIVKTGKIK